MDFYFSATVDRDGCQPAANTEKLAENEKSVAVTNGGGRKQLQHVLHHCFNIVSMSKWAVHN
jgi:hypothetical protein